MGFSGERRVAWETKVSLFRWFQDFTGDHMKP
jgi:hypothetical protein